MKLANLAEQKATSQDVKSFAQEIEKDHRQAENQLKDVAQKENITLPSSPNAKQQQEYQRLSNLSGQQFDHAYVQYMIKAHRNAISKFQHEANNGNVQDVKSFGSLTVPTLKQHLQRAQDIAGTSGSAARTNTRKRR